MTEQGESRYGRMQREAGERHARREAERCAALARGDFTKVVRLGTVPLWGESKRSMSVYVQIKYTDGRLSITGVEGPLPSGDALGSSGQIDISAADMTFAPGWDMEKVLRLRAIWERWHLNDMRPGCEHQRAEGWDKRPIDPTKPLHTYGRHIPGSRAATWNMLVWVTREEHPEGLLSEPCPVCRYKYGSAWLYEAVPGHVLDWLRALPDADKAPAWV